MPVIYEPRGKALEYSPLACNLYRGCSHGCVYCFAPSATYTDRAFFHSASFISPRKGIVDQIEKEAGGMQGDPRQVLFCFTTDPYQSIERNFKLTRWALMTMVKNRLVPQILTKAGAWAVERDMDLLQKARGIWASTLTTDDPEESIRWEPGAASPADRIESLRIAKAGGLSTWVSFEPVFNPSAVLRLIDQTHEFVDLYKVGKLNYHPVSKEIDWSRFLSDVTARLDRYGSARYIKKDLAAYHG